MKYIDLHCDTITLLKWQNKHLKDNLCQISINNLIKGNNLLQCFAIFVNFKKTNNPFIDCLKYIDYYYQELELNKDIIKPVYNIIDFYENQKNNKISALLTLEEGSVVNNDLDLLNIFYRLGVRMICLNWNYENGIGYPNFKNNDFKTPNVELGLTPFGVNMIKKMNELGIIIDVSHLSDKGFYDCIKYSTKPIVASHSNSRTVCNHTRNLTDEMIIKLYHNGGVMGMNFCAEFLSEKNGENTIVNVIKHIKHIKSIASIDVVAIGTDFDGINPNIDLDNASKMSELFKAMADEGFSKEEIEKVAYKNFIRVLEANLK